MDSNSNGQLGNRLRNLVVAIAAIVLFSTLFFGVKIQNSSADLAAVAEAATPYEVAMANNKPTIMEFYADWCTSCQSMAADNLDLENQYGEDVNFVMLNVDNNKWLPELTKFRVDGIPNFVFMDSNNGVIGNAVGLVPPEIMTSNLVAMLNQQPLPHNRLSGDKVSNFSAPTTADTTSPLDHR